jgi:enoyl-CoA hydratase/carnithine racemase
MTGDLVKTMRNCPQPIVGAIDGICAGAGAMMALACDLRYGTPAAKTAFLFTRVGLAGADMGACALLPRLIGQGRASELLFTGRAMTAQEGLAWASSTRCTAPTCLGAASNGADPPPAPPLPTASPRPCCSRNGP